LQFHGSAEATNGILESVAFTDARFDLPGDVVAKMGFQFGDGFRGNGSGKHFFAPSGDF
jgi:hypothetical protein